MKIQRAAFLMCIVAFCLASAGANAQTIYRIVDANGKVTFSDKPPVSADQGKVIGTGVGTGGAVAASALPFELRQIAAKYPVTLYSTSKCGPCDAGRSMLTGRGIPFTERTVNSPEDAEYFLRLTGGSSLPFMTIGGQRLKGYIDSEWSQYLDAAGYPATSALPQTYRNPAPTPLVALQKTTTQEKDEPKPAAAGTASPDLNAPSPANPAGIRF